MKWLTLILFVIWLVIGIAWVSLRRFDSNSGRVKSKRVLNGRQKRLSLITFTLFVLTLLIVPWRVNAQFLGFPLLSQVSYGWIWNPPGGFNPDLAGVVALQGDILFSWIIAEWIVLASLHYCSLRWTPSFRPLSAENKMGFRGLLSSLLLFVGCSLCALNPFGKERTSRAWHCSSSLSLFFGFQYLPPQAV